MDLGSTIARYWRRLQDFLHRSGKLWSRLSQFQRNLVVGLAIAAGLNFFEDLPLIRSTEDLYMDWINRVFVDTARLNTSPDRSGPGYGLIDINERSFEDWNRPFHVPRDRLAGLIQSAAESGARAIVVDVDLSRPGTDPEADVRLANYLHAYPDQAPELVLMRMPGKADEQGDPLPVWRSTIVDDAVRASSIHWAQPLFEIDTHDRVLRRWRLIEIGCLDGRPHWLPSAELLLDVLLCVDRDGWKSVRDQIDADLPQTCAAWADEGYKVTPRVRYPCRSLAGEAPKEIRLRPGAIEQRIIYSYSADAKRLPPEFGLITTPAHWLSKLDEEQRRQRLRDRIVVIGASYADSCEIHQTPVGPMPGALVLVNAIKSLHEIGQVHGPQLWIKLLIEVAVITLLAYLFSRFDSLSATVLTGLLVLVILIPVGFWLFRQATWIELAGPIAGMQIRDLWSGLLESRRFWLRARTGAGDD